MISPVHSTTSSQMAAAVGVIFGEVDVVMRIP
jgi:hypothetical protein